MKISQIDETRLSTLGRGLRAMAHKNQVVWQTSIFALDFRGGSVFYSDSSHMLTVPYFKSELILMPPGTHLIEVGARTEEPILQLWCGEVILKITEYDPNLHIGLEYPSAP